MKDSMFLMQKLPLHARLSTQAASWPIGVVVQEAMFHLVFVKNCEGPNMKTKRLASFLSSNFHQVMQRGPSDNCIHSGSCIGEDH